MIDDSVSIPTLPERIDKIVYYQINPSVSEYKVMGDKIIFRGKSRFHVLYLDIDGILQTWDEEFLFSQFSELGREYTDEAIASVIMATTSAELDKGEGGFRLRAGFTGQFVIFDHEKVSIVKDAYSIKRNVDVITSPFEMPSVLDVQQHAISVECKLGDECSDVVDAVMTPAHPRCYRDAENVNIEYCGAIRALCQCLDGEMTTQSLQFDSKKNEIADTSVKAMITVSDYSVPQVITSGGSLFLTGSLDSNCLWRGGNTSNMVTALEIGEICESLEERPGVVLRKASGNSLWELAKEYGSKPELIADANRLEDEPDPDRLLIIPIL